MQHIHQQLEKVFNHILQHKMADMPIINPKLKVEAVGFRAFEELIVGVLVTPWFMNLILLPQTANDWQQQQLGDKISYQFPNGLFEFTLAYEESLGFYASCSLYSPMFEFQEQEVAVATAKAALIGLFNDESLTTAAIEKKQNKLSRRDLLRGVFKH